jgi:signal peptidase I
MDDNNNNNNNEKDNINDYDGDLPEIKPTQAMIDAEYFDPDAQSPRVAERLFDLVEIAAGAFLVVILIFTFVLRLVTVHGPSMQETLHDRDSLMISHLFFSPKQGDIVVIQVPNPQYDTPIIKRVIATAGQTIDFDFVNWTVIVDGEPIEEPYVNFDYRSPMRSDDLPLGSLPITVGPGKIFVLGDNRNMSSDSRSSSIGQVDVRRDIVGRVLVRVWPFHKFGTVKPNES